MTIGGRYYGYVYGATISGQIWRNSMSSALKDVDPSRFTPVNMDRFGGCSEAARPRPPGSRVTAGTVRPPPTTPP